MYYNFFFNATATTEIYTLSLHDALPISAVRERSFRSEGQGSGYARTRHRTIRLSFPALFRRSCVPGRCQEGRAEFQMGGRSEEHTSELQSQSNLVCRLLLEKKKN